ncbi:beta-ribofuranosylaminobenzene 5'-phosphate synthase [Variovorax paradoxus]|nr:beta-ribofuranosylaminobenzene 5'-phosphate synthase [Variovorax paradoxus]
MTAPPAALASRPGLSVRTVSVSAPGRLHLGFLDPAASLGRAFGSLGLVIDGFTTEVELAAAPADELKADTPAAEAELARALAYLELLRRQSGCDACLSLRLRQVLSPHAGFGSGTQLASAIGRAFAEWHGLDLSTATLAHWLGRGVRSGIGIAGFDSGGLLLDGGPGADGLPAPLLSRLAFPPAWRVILVQDPAHRGLSGGAEKKAIAALLPLPQASAAEICHQVLMRVLPGAASAEFAPFAAGIQRMQQLLGEHFAPAQGGAFTSAAVGRLMQWFADASRKGGIAIGQSSWGPTGFAIVPSQAQAELLVDAARAAGQIDARLKLRIVAGRNRGAEVRHGTAAELRVA